MRLRLLCVLAVLLCVASAASGAVRIGIKGGKRVIYNDGVGPSSREVLGKSDSWLAARIATPSLYDGLIADAARSSAALAATTPMSAAVREASEPPNLPIGVRTAERMKTSFTFSV